MTRPNRHRVQRQIVELAVGASAEGPAVHRELGREFWDRAIPELEQVFDSSAGPDELLRLDRLELDLGTLGGGDWPSEFRKKLVAELTRTLAQFTAVREPGENSRGDGGPAEAWRQFLFFLAHGRLPWWATAVAGRWSDVLPKGSDADWTALRETIRSDSRARLRFVYSVDDELVERAIAAWTGVSHAARVMEALTPRRIGVEAQRRWRTAFWMMVLDGVLTGGFPLPRGGPLLVRELMALRHMYDAAGGGSGRDKQAPDDGREPGGPSRTVAVGDLPEPWRAWYLSQDEAAPFVDAVTERRTGTGEATGRAPAGSPPRSRTPERTRRAVEGEAIYVAGAGAVLVHPFLERLFRERELLEGRSFRGPEARDRAVHLIGLITFGRVDLAEHELVLAKALCGVDLEEPLEPVHLGDEDIAACDALLRAVLEHWTALRSSSPEWLREQFFWREGKLAIVDAGWLLTIERRAQDVLLARLPWGFGVVAPPWVKAQVFVHWLD